MLLTVDIGPETEQCARDVLLTVDIGPETEQCAHRLKLCDLVADDSSYWCGKSETYHARVYLLVPVLVLFMLLQAAHLGLLTCGNHGNPGRCDKSHDCVCVFRVIHRVAAYLLSRDIAHNFFVTRGSVFDVDGERAEADIGESEQTSTVRAYLWPRKSVFGEFHQLQRKHHHHHHHQQ